MKGGYRICERVYAVGGEGITGSGDCCIYLVDCGDGLLLIDSGLGMGVERMMEVIRSLGFDPPSIRMLILTHSHIDHIGGAKRIKDLTNCEVVAHELDVQVIEHGGVRTGAGLYGVRYDPVKVDRVIKGETERIELGDLEIDCIHTPGHTPGSISVLVEVEKQRVLFGQDIHGPFAPEWGSDITIWRESMEKLLELGADILCEGHFGVFRGKDEVRRYIEGYLDYYS